MIKNDDNLQSILQKRETPKLNNDFEDNMMAMIHSQVAAKETNKKNFILIYLFFALGLALGFIISFSFENITIPFYGFTVDISKYAFTIPLVFGLLFLFEKVYKTILFQQGKKRIFEM